MFKIKSCFMVHNKAKHQSKHICVTNVDITKHSRVILNFSKNQNMKVLNIPVSNVNIRQHDRTSLRHTNNINMKVSNIYVSNVNIRQRHRDFLRLTNNLTMRCWILLYPQSKTWGHVQTYLQLFFKWSKKLLRKIEKIQWILKIYLSAFSWHF